ncbi:MAG TPA: hypothetical protein VJ892_02870 [Candidatus Absconditabacterales bacterium]|nr:hypothetical protein [Candidatus Absconditabacterales bacterium]
MKNLFILLILAGFTFQSCEKQEIEEIKSPDKSYPVLSIGEYNDGKYQVPYQGMKYTSKDGLKIWYCEYRPENGELIYDEIFSPRKSIGIEYADWKSGDTVLWVPRNPEQVIKIKGELIVLE